jgi:hypothetical protein
MATTTAEDISVVLSGGSLNSSPDNSLGGDPSSTPVVDEGLNNLFRDVTADESADGHEDYRCVYLFNDGDSPVFNLTLWIAEDFDDGATMEIGVEEADELQRVTISGFAVTGGSFTMSYLTHNFTVNASTDLAVWSANFQDAIDGITDDDDNPVLKNVEVTAQNVGSTTVIFDIVFTGREGQRNHPKFVLVTNNLTPLGLDVLITVPQEGAPVNTVAPEINIETTPPGGVTFLAYSSLVPITLPYLLPAEGFPLWIKRTVAEGTDAKENDGIKIRIRGESLESIVP